MMISKCWIDGRCAMRMNENIERVLAELDGFRMCDQMDYDAYSRLHDSISELDDLLKIQEPVKPMAILTTGSGCSSADCPRCKKRINDWHNPFFCGNCGQAVRWE
jgi:hypothetical protein